MLTNNKYVFFPYRKNIVYIEQKIFRDQNITLSIGTF